MQTEQHVILKWKALELLYKYFNCDHVIMEMKVGPYIYDTVGCDGSRVIIIEAKQDANDYKRDCNKPEDIREAIESYKKLIHETGEIKKYTKLIKTEREKSCKFYDESILKLSSSRYIIAPSGLVSDVPPNWGLINDHLKIVKECEKTIIDAKYSYKIIREISKRQTKYFLEQNGVVFGKTIQFPQRELNYV